MATRIFGPSKGNRRPTQVAPSKTPVVRPTAQKGGGGNKEAGSVEPTAATAPTVSVSPTGEVTTEHFGPSPAQRQRAQAARQAEQQSKRRVQKVRTYVRQRDAEPKREVHISKAFLDKAASPKPVTVAAHTRALPGATKPSVPVAKHQRALPSPQSLSPTALGKLNEKKIAAIKKEGLAGSSDLSKVKAVEAKLEAGREPKLKGSPQERVQARKQLVTAKRQVAKAKPELLGDFGPGQKQFIEQTAKETGLNPKTIAIQSIAEEGHGSGSPAAGYEAEGENNFLNLGPGQHFSTPQAGAAATAANFNNTASSNYAGVRATKGQSVEAQLAAIQESPWDGGHYQGSMLQKILQSGEVQVKPGDPQAVKNYKVAIKKAKSLGLKVGPPPPDIRAEPATKTIKVKATAEAGVQWLEANIGEQETGAKIQRLGENFGLNTVTEPWCANLASNNLARRGFKTSELPANPNYTPSYEEWGQEGKYATVVGTSEAEIAKAKKGDILTFSGEHTATYAGNGEMISGNFSDEVERTPVSAHANLSMIIRPHYKGGWIKVKESTPLPGTTSSTGSLTESAAPAIVSAVSTPPTSTEGQKKQGEAHKKELTPLQQIRQNVNKLKRLGTEIAGPGEETKAEAADKPGSSSLHTQLAALEKRYSIGAV